MIQVCVHNVCLVYHICHAGVECQDFKNFLKDERVKFVTVDFRNDRDVLGRIGLVVGQPFDLQKASLVEKPHHEFNHAWESKKIGRAHV